MYIRHVIFVTACLSSATHVLLAVGSLKELPVVHSRGPKLLDSPNRANLQTQICTLSQEESMTWFAYLLL